MDRRSDAEKAFREYPPGKKILHYPAAQPIRSPLVRACPETEQPRPKDLSYSVRPFHGHCHGGQNLS